MMRLLQVHRIAFVLIALIVQGLVGMTFAQSDGTRFTADTTYIRAQLDRADRGTALWQLDTVAHYAELALARVLPLTENTALMQAPDRRRAVLHFKARCLELLGRASQEIDDLSKLDEALTLYTELGDVRSQAQVHHHYSERLSTMGEPLEGIAHKRTAIELMEQLGDQRTAAEWLNSLGVNYRVLGQPSTALKYHLEVLPIMEALGDSTEIAFTYILIGAVHRSTAQWPGALHHFHIARGKYEELQDTLGLSMAYNDLGTAWYGAGNMDSAMYWHRKAADLREHVDYFHGIAYSHQFMAQIHRREGRYEQAITEYRIAMANFARVPTYSQVASIYGDIAQIQKEQGNADSALVTITQALTVLQQYNEAQFATQLYVQAGDIHAYRDEFSEAERAYLKAMEIARKSQILDLQQGIAKRLSNLYEDHGDLHRAYLNHTGYLALRDTVRSRSGKSEVLRMMLQHNADQAEQEKERRQEARRIEQQAELGARERQKHFYLAGGGLLFVLALGLVGRMRFSARSKRELEQQQRDLQGAKERAEQSERFKERFLANMSHEIRTPMNAIMGMTAIMRRGERLPHQQVYFDAIAQSADNLLHIINDILDLSKLDADRVELEMTPIDPRTVVEGIAQDIGPRARDKGLELRIDLDPDIGGTVLGDATRLRQLLMNLVENAVKYTTRGHVQLSAGIVGVEKASKTISFSVSDTGPGIPKERMDTIFEEFNKAYAYSEGHGRYGGTGLSLAISKRLTELHGGELVVTSEVGKGSTFTATITFQVVAVEEGTIDQKPDVELRDLRILVADDNEFNIMVASDELTDAIPGVRVEVARNGREAVDLSAETDFDAILMDVQMPEMNGYDATIAIREREAGIGPGRRTPILAMSANAMGTEIARCREAGMDGYVSKPFRREDLLAELRAVIHRTGDA